MGYHEGGGSDCKRTIVDLPPQALVRVTQPTTTLIFEKSARRMRPLLEGPAVVQVVGSRHVGRVRIVKDDARVVLPASKQMVEEMGQLRVEKRTERRSRLEQDVEVGPVPVELRQYVGPAATESASDSMHRRKQV